MDKILVVIIGLAMFMFLITIHELGHFIGAKLSGIKVNEFSVGMGPTIYNRQGKETLYSLRALPIGGYVMMEGEESGSDDPRSYNNSKAWKRFLTIFAGPFVNLFFAFILFIIIGTINGVPSTTIDEVIENSPAHIAGLEKGDKIISVNGKTTKTFSEISLSINESEGNVDIKVERNNEIKNFNLEPVKNSEGYRLAGFKPLIENNLLSNTKYAFNTVISIMVLIFNSLKGLVSGVLGFDQLSGPVGVIKQVGQTVNMGATAFLTFVAMISVNLGFFNLLPIPALDGSKLLFILFEMITRKPVNKKFEERITIAGFLFLLGLIILVTIKDIWSLFG